MTEHIWGINFYLDLFSEIVYYFQNTEKRWNKGGHWMNG